MKKGQMIAKSLVGFGCLLVLTGAALHMLVAYPKVSAALATSNLNAELQNALRAVFFMIGEAWIVLAILALVGALTETHIRKPVVLICGLALLLELPTWVHLMGWFIGNEILAIAGSLIVVGGLLFHNRSAV